MRHVYNWSEEKETILDIAFYTSLYILLLIFINTAITSMLWFFKVSISIFHFPSSLLISCIILYMIMHKNCKPSRVFILTIASSAAILFCTVAISALMLDNAYDSLAYHKFAIGCMADGWNPVLESSFYFNQRVVRFPGILPDIHAIWIDHYAKLPWMLGATIYKITGNIESSKIMGPLYAFVSFLLVFNYFGKRYFNMLSSILLGLIVAITPVTLVQLFTFYTDGLLASSLYVLLIALVMLTDHKYSLPEGVKLLLIFLSLSLIINIKFTGFGFAGIFCSAFWIFWVLRAFFDKKIRQAEIIRTTAVMMAAVLFSVLFIGYSTYVKNYMEHNHIFYPLFGQNKVDIMTGNQPKSFAVKTGIEKLLLGTFSRCSNLSIGEDPEPVLKIPFSISSNELRPLGGVDLRISGFGIWYSGILIPSVIIIFLGLYSLFKKRNFWFYPVFLVILASSLLLLLLEDSWWARYSPHNYLYIIIAVIFVLAYLKNNPDRLSGRRLAITFILLTVMNVAFFAAVNPICRIIQSSTAYTNLLNLKKAVKNEQIEVLISPDSFTGAVYNLRDMGLNIKVKYEAGNEEYQSMDVFGMRYKLVK